MTEFWDLRYADPRFAYGTEPNRFFSEQLKNLQPGGKLLFPAEGEGRNAVFAARQGFDTYAFDISREGMKKAGVLAAGAGVTIDYKLAPYESVAYPADFFDAIVLVFAHMPADKRTEWHRKLTGFLKSGGVLILEGFSKEQLAFGTGGPQKPEMLFSIELLKEDFKGLTSTCLVKEVVELDEGLYHQGKASVIRGIFVKEPVELTRPVP